MLELLIRPTLTSDLDDIMGLVRACIEDMRGRGIDQWDEVYPSRDIILADISTQSHYAACLRTGSMVGMFTRDEYQCPEWAAVPWTILGVRTAVVHRLMVEPRYQGQGVARQLMQFAESRASQAGFACVRLDAFSLNPQALRLYQRLGYREAGSASLRKGVFRCLEKRLGTAP